MHSETILPTPTVRQAIRLSYAQAMLGAIYGASTGGVFLIGYALKLGAQNNHIGLLSTLPMLCVVAQLFASMAAERGVSRRRMTVLSSIVNALGWGVVICLPAVFHRTDQNIQVHALIAIITTLTFFGHVAGNARASWVGDLIPERIRGTFFGQLNVYGGIIAAVISLAQGLFLDHVAGMGMPAFRIVFILGMLFGLANALLFMPQPDVPLKASERQTPFLSLVKQTFANKALMSVAVFALLWSMQGIAGPFYPTYMLRDLKMSYFGVGILSGVGLLAMLLASPCRPVLLICACGIAPLPCLWKFAASAPAVYSIFIPVNAISGTLSAGIAVALTTLVYKVTPKEGRSVQLAIYSILVVLLAAPMPMIGGYLPGWLSALGLSTDLRCTFYAQGLFILAAAYSAKFIQDDGAATAGEMVFQLPIAVKRWRKAA